VKGTFQSLVAAAAYHGWWNEILRSAGRTSAVRARAIGQLYSGFWRAPAGRESSSSSPTSRRMALTALKARAVSVAPRCGIRITILSESLWRHQITRRTRNRKTASRYRALWDGQLAGPEKAHVIGKYLDVVERHRRGGPVRQNECDVLGIVCRLWRASGAPDIDY
jgi:hypothetical protein